MKKNIPSEQVQPVYFHGGVPGLVVGEQILPASKLGLRFAYHNENAVYDPNWVYLTTDLGVAEAYAARYLDEKGIQGGGNVYSVIPQGAIEPDPDYAKAFPHEFVRVKTASVCDVLRKGVHLNINEQAEREGKYLFWERLDLPVYADDGTMNPSQAMLDAGVGYEWTSLLKKWIAPEEIDSLGRLIALYNRDISYELADVILSYMPTIDSRHQILEKKSKGILSLLFGGFKQSPIWRCENCEVSFRDHRHAAIHQLGEREMKLFNEVHGSPFPPNYLILAAYRRAPERWQWYIDYLEASRSCK